MHIRIGTLTSGNVARNGLAIDSGNAMDTSRRISAGSIISDVTIILPLDVGA